MPEGVGKGGKTGYQTNVFFEDPLGVTPGNGTPREDRRPISSAIGKRRISGGVFGRRPLYRI
jgi:hypothetical protein